MGELGPGQTVLTSVSVSGSSSNTLIVTLLRGVVTDGETEAQRLEVSVLTQGHAKTPPMPQPPVLTPAISLPQTELSWLPRRQLYLLRGEELVPRVPVPSAPSLCTPQRVLLCL